MRKAIGLPIVAFLLLVPTAAVSTATAKPVSNRAVYSCGGYTATIVGTNGTDVLNGTASADVIVGLGGNDVIKGGGGGDFICGGDGIDDILAGDGADQIWGGNGNDRINGMNNNDTIHGGPGSDALWDGSGYDFVFGDADNASSDPCLDGIPDNFAGGNLSQHDNFNHADPIPQAYWQQQPCITTTSDWPI
jgi:hypothetical protein